MTGTKAHFSETGDYFAAWMTAGALCVGVMVVITGNRLAGT